MPAARMTGNFSMSSAMPSVRVSVGLSMGKVA